MGDPVVYAADELRPPVHRLDTADWDGASRSADGSLFPEHDGRPIAIPKTHRVYRRLDAVFLLPIPLYFSFWRPWWLLTACIDWGRLLLLAALLATTAGWLRRRRGLRQQGLLSDTGA